jgi:hypothetical protein
MRDAFHTSPAGNIKINVFLSEKYSSDLEKFGGMNQFCDNKA